MRCCANRPHKPKQPGKRTLGTTYHSTKSMKYDIAVLTHISQGSVQHARDEIIFYGVGDSVKDMIAGSCKVTLGRLLKLPEDKSPAAWNLRYRTVVREAGTTTIVSDTGTITFPGMDGKAMKEFKYWAVDQLRETIDAVNAELGDGPIATKKRSKLMAIVKMLASRH